jgi:hypothetical protein
MLQKGVEKIEIKNFAKFKPTLKELGRAVERGGEAVIFTGALTSKEGPRERNLPLFESYFKILPGPRIKSTILSTALELGQPIKVRLKLNFTNDCTGSTWY